MAKKPATRSKRTTKKTSKVKTAQRNNKFIAVVAIVLFAAIGTYFIVASHAQSVQSEQNALQKQLNNPTLGIDYTGETIQTKGPCKGEVIDTTAEASAHGKPVCLHQDPGPAGQDVRVRTKKFDQDLKDQIAFDKAHPALATDAPLDDPADATPEDQTVDNTDSAPIAPTDTTGSPTTVQAADTGNAGSLNAVNGRNWPCVTDGKSGPRVRVIYAYPAGGTNRLSAVRSVIENTMRRVNNVVYASSNGHRQIIFLTNASCGLSIPAIPITGNINSMSNIEKVVAAAGYKVPDRKFLIEVDANVSSCGQGDVVLDDTAGTGNYNEIFDNYAAVWKGCWNYAEPHEFMHTLGAVQTSAPHATTLNHCYDQHDIMCYQDGGGKVMRIACANTTQIWRFDCNDNDYFATTPIAGSYLATHWNAADSSFLYKS